MRRHAAFIAFASLVLASSAAIAQQAAPSVTPRATAEAVAARVEEVYFDPARAHTIAEGLRTRAQAGEYDRFTNPLDLATALTGYLHPFDGHFRVLYSADPRATPNAGPGPGPGGPGQRPPPGAPISRNNFGFSKVEILPGNIGYVRVEGFSPFDPRGPADQPARRAADAAMAMVWGSRAIILDLRDSHGGAPAMVGYLASHFVAADANIYNTFHSRRGDSSEAPVIEPTNGRRLDVPLYILVDGNAGSASESFPYTLQAAHRAVIVGEPTGGAANPGGMIPVPGGFSVFVSGGSPENPITHTNWEGAGVQPDVRVASADALERAQVLALQQLLAADGQGPLANDTRWALEALQTPAQPTDAAALGAYAGAYGDARIEAGSGVLMLREGRRFIELTPIGPDLFRVSATTRVQFERQNGRVIAATMLNPNGPTRRLLRS